MKKELWSKGSEGHERDILTNVLSLQKFKNDFNIELGNAIGSNGEFNWKVLMVVSIVNIREIMDYYGLIEGDKSIQKIARQLQSAFKDSSIYRISHPRFVVVNPKEVSFAATYSFNERETVAIGHIRINDSNSEPIEVKDAQDLVEVLIRYRLDDRRDSNINIRHST